MTRCALIFTDNDGNQYVNVGELHEFEPFTRESIQRARVFPDEKFCASYPYEMIRRGVWDDLGVYQHTWVLHNHSSVKRRIYTTKKFVEKLNERKKEHLWKSVMDILTYPEYDDVGFLNPDNYSVMELLLVPKQFTNTEVLD